MKKKYLSIIFSLLMVVMLVAPVCAQEPRLALHNISLSIEDNIATCSVTIGGGQSTDIISATITLSGGGQKLYWYPSESGVIKFNQEVPVTSGESYKLTANYTINGVAQPTLSDSATCP